MQPARRRIRTADPSNSWRGQPSARLLAIALLLCLVIAGCGTTTGTPSAERSRQAVEPNPVPTIVVLDASDSMNTDDAPGPRLAAAKAAVQALIDGLPADNTFGVVTFGSQIPAAGTPPERGCTDVSTPIPLAPLDRTTINSDLEDIRAQGFTPIGLALQEAAANMPTGPSSIVLVSDGESTCTPDPCETATAIHAQRPDITISTVGFRTDAESLQCVAEQGGGLFITADNAAQLSSRLAAAQNTRAAASRLSPTSRDGLEIGQNLGDIHTANPDFPSSGRRDGNREIIVWLDCEYTFTDGVLTQIAPGNPPGSAGTTIDGVTAGTPGSQAVDLYGDPIEDADGVAVFVADRTAGTAYRVGYTGGSSVADGTITWVILCQCLPAEAGESDSGADDGGTKVVRVVAVDKAGSPTNGFTRGSSGQPFTADDIESCTVGFGAVTAGVFTCGYTAEGPIVCWPAGNELLCTPAPWETSLSVRSYSGTLPTVRPNADVFPWALELANGAQCMVRSGGAWPVPPQGFEFGFSCRTASDQYGFVFYAPETRVLFDETTADWTVFYGDGESAPTPIGVTKAFYSAADS